MYKQKIKIEKDVMYLEGGDCIKVYWRALGVDKCVLGYNITSHTISVVSLKDGGHFIVPRSEHGVTIEAIERASGGNKVEYIGKLKSTEHSSEKYIFVKEE
jgi:hypothetical protein